jgi:hypothetical protein
MFRTLKTIVTKKPFARFSSPLNRTFMDLPKIPETNESPEKVTSLHNIEDLVEFKDPWYHQKSIQGSAALKRFVYENSAQLLKELESLLG